MKVCIEVGDEQFEVLETCGPGEVHQYDFTWLSGPVEGTYGFSVKGGRLTRGALEHAASTFVSSFFAADGIGPSDFPSFVEARRAAKR